MRKLLLSPEYHCCPLWLYNEDGCVEENLLLEELADHMALAGLLEEIGKTYDGFFIDDGVEFSYVGPSSEEERSTFETNLNRAYDMVQTAVGKRYEVILEVVI